ncbi:hypothetical protein [Lewinella sp. W8]|uniref:hypothetical protein n=1 Tax=Lewinella sp. W8 TaxID=2528208 RepID=UPI001067BD13|nr:hypothetical protein [Lewinella sp. W8]MTB52231.1 hypothetical protein [Lewinella sp. W8]
MSAPKTDPKLGEKPRNDLPGQEERDRLRDIIVVIVTYPLTPTKRADQLARRKPWLEFISLLLKVALAAYALYQAAMSGGAGASY